MGIADEIKQSFKKGNYLTKLIYVNIGVFIAFNIVRLVYYISNAHGVEEIPLVEWLSVPANPAYLLLRPWTIITYMFFHYEFMHTNPVKRYVVGAAQASQQVIGV